jgi:hypothetical protein
MRQPPAALPISHVITAGLAVQAENAGEKKHY